MHMYLYVYTSELCFFLHAVAKKSCRDCPSTNCPSSRSLFGILGDLVKLGHNLPNGLYITKSLQITYIRD